MQIPKSSIEASIGVGCGVRMSNDFIEDSTGIRQQTENMITLVLTRSSATEL